MNRIDRCSLAITFGFLLCCGGSGGGTQPPPETSSNFTLALAPQGLTLLQGQAGNVTVTVTRTGGFAAAVVVTVSGLPTGVTAAPLAVAAEAADGTLALSVGSAASLGAVSVTVVGTGGGASHSAPLALTVTAPGGGGLDGAPTSWNGGSPPDLSGYRPFPADNAWNRDVSADPLDPNSDAIMADIVANDPPSNLHPDFGSGSDSGQHYGLTYDVVAGNSVPMRTVSIGPDGYADESDPGPADSASRVPIPVPLPDVVHPEAGYDHHVLLLDKDNHWLYELYHAELLPAGWQADQVTLWDLDGNTRRPWTWTSADEAGLSLFAGLVRYDQVVRAIPSNGDIGHAVRFTVMSDREEFIPPATHPGGGGAPYHTHSPMMGQRLRLKASWLAAHSGEYSPANRVILRSLARYGMILADTGGNLFIQGTWDDRWDQDDLGHLLDVPAAAFEVVAHAVHYSRESHPSGAAPVIAAFAASPASVAAGAAVTLSWDVTGASTLIVTPGVGPLRGNSVVVHPTVSTDYTLYATSEYGRTTRTVRVEVH